MTGDTVYIINIKTQILSANKVGDLALQQAVVWTQQNTFRSGQIVMNKTAKEIHVRFFECLSVIIKYESPFSVFTESGILSQIKPPLFC